MTRDALLFQILWREKRVPLPCQTSHKLGGKTHVTAKGVKVGCLSRKPLVIMLIDNFSIHTDDDKLEWVSAIVMIVRTVAYTCVCGFPQCLYVLNPGDQSVNITLPSHLQQRSQFRMPIASDDSDEGR
mmetsp:Transcript_107965/g.186227  ORF Transcript_107965/g.186227 Transcript_107965/m.186227 type:complete len:128 (-) Transcript_107965:6-389(-)